MGQEVIQQMIEMQRTIQAEYDKMINSQEYKDMQFDLSNIVKRYGGYAKKSWGVELKVLQRKKNQCMRDFYHVYKKGICLMYRKAEIITNQDKATVIGFIEFMQSFKLL